MLLSASTELTAGKVGSSSTVNYAQVSLSFLANVTAALRCCRRVRLVITLPAVR
jgi:hypothetical protein